MHRTVQTAATSSEICDNKIFVGDKQIIIQQVALDDHDELKAMSAFCINAFYRSNKVEDNDGSFMSRQWKDIKLAAMQKAQLLVRSHRFLIVCNYFHIQALDDVIPCTQKKDLSLSIDNNRCIFVAKPMAEDNPYDGKSTGYAGVCWYMPGYDTS